MQTVRTTNVAFVPDDNMCTGCGICAAVCPYDVIDIFIDSKKGVYQSNVDVDNCTECTICLKSCPPLTWSNKQHTNQYNELVGDYISSYAVYSNDKEIRKDSASGGFITTLLIYLLENNYINGAVVVKRDEKNPLISKPFIATTVNDIKEAKGSKYSPVKYDEIIKDIINNDYEKLALVGLPCHIEAIAKASKKNKKLRDKIEYKISIVCGQAPSFLGYEYIAKKFDINVTNFKELKNRGDGWPGFMQIKTDKKDIKVPYGSKYSMGTVLSSPLFTPLACQMCADAVGFEADISVSDAWLDKYTKEKSDGYNLILIKNQELNYIIEKLKAENIMTFFDEDIDSFIKANKSVIYNKGKYNSYRLAKFLGIKDRYSKNMLNTSHLTMKDKIKLSIFTWHLNIIKKLDLSKVVKILNDKVLIYFKILNLLKR